MNRPLGHSPAALIALLSVAATGYLYSNIFLLPHTPILQSDDQVYFWMHAQRMLNGERPYIDFFQYTPPGTDLFFLFLFKLFGARIWVLNLAAIALGIALSWACFLVASQVMQRHLAVLSAFLYLIFIFSQPLNATHHWFSVLIIMCAVSIVMIERTPRTIAVSGGLLGLASFFTQTHGVAALAAFAIFLIWEQTKDKKAWREVFLHPAVLCLSFAASALALNGYFIASTGIKHLWYEQVTYVRRYVVQGLPSVQNLGLPGPLTWQNLPMVGQQVFVYLMLPAVYLLSLYRVGVREPVSNDQRRIALVSLVGLFLLAEVALSPNWLRIYAVSMPSIIVAVWMIGRTETVRRRYAVGVIWAGITCLALLHVWVRQHRPYITAGWPGGAAAVPASKYEELDWIKRHTKPGEFFFQAAWPGTYVPLGLRNPLFVDVVGPDEQTRPEDVDLAIRQLEQKRVRYVLWSERLDTTSRDHSSESHLGPLQGYLRSRYNPVATFADQDEVWERKNLEIP
jgi:hypothetical protein